MLNLFESSEEELRKGFDSLEHEGFYDSSVNDDTLTNSILGAFQDFERLIDEGIFDTLEDYSFDIYGPGGDHRYFVHLDGNIVFSGMHCGPSCSRRHPNPADLGFEVDTFLWEKVAN